MLVEVRMPDVGGAQSEVRILRWLAQAGETVRRGEPLLEVETDKSALEIEAVVTGRLESILAGPGEEVAAGRVIARIQEEPVAVAAAPTATPDAPRPSILGESTLPSPAPLRSSRSPAATDHARGFLLDMYERMVLIREFEEGVKLLFLEGSMPGTIHQCQGQEATAVGVCAALGTEDFITSTFRGHGHALARGLTPEQVLFELFGAATGCCGGKGGSMHVGDMAKGMVPGIAIVGGSIPLAAGMGLAAKLRGERRVVACFFGDGAVAEGAFHEGVNLAAIWDLPVVFVCENNLYGASTHVRTVTRIPRLADRAGAYGIRGETVDGNDVLEVFEAARRAVDECRAGQGPILLELRTYRRTGHSRRDACDYQPAGERESWFERDPIPRLAARLLARGDVTEEDLESIRIRILERFDAAVAAARAQPLPPLDALTQDVLAPAEAAPARSSAVCRASLAGTRGECTTNRAAESLDTSPQVGRRLTIAEALREGIAEELERDTAVFCMGEDIGVPGGWGGAFTVTLGLEQRFPDRILNTPIAELGFFGAGVGAAIMGMRPIVDVQYGDFLFLAMDPIINNAAKLRYMSGGAIRVPLVMRAPVGATGRGAQHAQNMERFFIGVPGLKVVAVSTAYDAKGILKAAVRDDNPVLIFEHKLLYGARGARAESAAIDASSEVPERDYTVPLDRAAVRREGSDVTILAWLLMLHYALAAADTLAREGIAAEVIDVRSLAPIDWKTIGGSVEKTGRALIVEEGPVTGGVGAELAAGIAERWSAPIRRIASPDTPVPFSPVLEDAYRPDPGQIATGAREMAGGW